MTTETAGGARRPSKPPVKGDQDRSIGGRARYHSANHTRHHDRRSIYLAQRMEKIYIKSWVILCDGYFELSERRVSVAVNSGVWKRIEGKFDKVIVRLLMVLSELLMILLC